MASLVGQSLGRYQVLDQLGEGGMAVVYKAYDTHLDRPAAVKVILPGFEHSEKFLKRFEREARALAKLSHPNIVGVIDYGQHNGLPYLVMEYLPGGTLKQKLGQPMPWQEAARLLAPIARALAYAHQEGILHRDIKPSNILITQSGEPMLSDFGLAKILEVQETVDLTGSTGVVGTPEYMAPEQITSGEMDGRADIYALGVVFYELVSGRKPYRADTPAAVMIKAVTEPLPRPTEFLPSLPEKVEQVILKTLDKNPDNRYQSMDELAQILERFAGDREPATATGATIIPASPQSFHAALAPTTRSTPSAAPSSTPSSLRPAAAPPKKSGWLGWALGGGGLLALGLVFLLVVAAIGYFLTDGFTNFTFGAAPTATTRPATKVPTRTPALPPTSAPSGVLFEDDFSDPNSGWNTWSDSDGTIEYTAGGLRLYVIAANMDIWSRANQTFPADVRIEVDAAKIGGPDDNDFGVVCRYQDGSNFYFALISSDGYQGIGRMQNDDRTLLSADSLLPADAIRQGEATNHIRFDCVGSDFALYVNDILVSTASDSTFTTGGDVALLAGTFSIGGADILFQNLVVYQP